MSSVWNGKKQWEKVEDQDQKTTIVRFRPVMGRRNPVGHSKNFYISKSCVG